MVHEFPFCKGSGPYPSERAMGSYSKFLEIQAYVNPVSGTNWFVRCSRCTRSDIGFRLRATLQHLECTQGVDPTSKQISSRQEHTMNPIFRFGYLALLVVALLFSIIAISLPGWGKVDPPNSGKTYIGWNRVCGDTSNDNCLTFDSRFSDNKYYKAGQAAVACSVIAELCFAAAIVFVVLRLIPWPLASVLTIDVFRYLCIGLCSGALVFQALSWILWVGIAKPGDDPYTHPDVSFALSLIASVLAIPGIILPFIFAHADV
ncbi:hypothetical protein PROFUN_10373 [Planoprotostelium fungivorum]|uniref:Uncharacterized protein n=1 Tax=Planoprotostelium fungivorum TaxID=1890364 RepID=A0A2P6NEE4_9EUKA|nr:hypothetical protein PROFUN_10373 [Planoprotostelium fungivorum]